ncbi:hypothetical protein CD798_01750 [Bacillaceae bacterium SAOS 7]|nr:hypothetical protein CD798_01750 [Bacillaceae bacterium SAOS 7]
MLIDINLLPEKEKKSVSIVYWLLLLVVLMVISAGGYFVIQAKKSELSLIDSQLNATIQLRETLEMNSQQPNGEEDRVKQLNEAIAWAEKKQDPVSPILKDLIERLPQRGFFQSLAYSSTEKMTLTIQFDSSRQAAFYLSDLQASSWIASAEMLSMNTSVEKEQAAKELLKNKNALPRYIAEYEIVFKPKSERGEKK